MPAAADIKIMRSTHQLLGMGCYARSSRLMMWAVVSGAALTVVVA